ncbi:HAD family hydrolase [bacterium]|nr:HAD family hydrolase [bacterium]
MLKGLLFDWDGTLCDSLPVCVGAFRMTIQRYTGKELTTEEIMDHFGMNEKGILELKMADRPEIWAEALEDYNANYRKLHEKVRAPFPGLKELIADMRKKGVIVGLITGKGETSCAISLEMTGLTDAFDFVRTGSDKCLNKVESIEIFLNKFSLAPEDVYYVGDAASDVAQAKAAGVHSVAVTWNCIVDREGIEREKPEAVFQEVSEFNKYLNGLLK